MFNLIRNHLKRNRFSFKKGKLNIKYVIYEIVHHCNFRCFGCDHCAPLAKEEFTDINQFKEDLIRLKNSIDKLDIIGLMGGEPLLHPDLPDFILEARKILPETKIYLYTNGILLLSKDDKFWNALKETNTEIKITLYDTKNEEKIAKLCEDKNIIITTEREKTKEKLLFKKIKFDLKGKQSSILSHILCQHANKFISIEKGKLYKCTVICGARHFNEFFNTKMDITNKDYIDLYKNPTKKEIYNYLRKEMNFCRYCNILKRKNHHWEHSKKDIKEWT